MIINEEMSSSGADGFVHITIRNIETGEVIRDTIEKNIIKIFAKEVFSHSIIPARIWDPIADQWVNHSVDVDMFKVRYITFGASFDENNEQISGIDSRYYTPNTITGGIDPIRLGAGATYDGDLINPIPISDAGRPLKKIEKIYFSPSYQPAGNPLVYGDVRAINNVVVFQTTLRPDEYNSLTGTTGDSLTITESQLVAAPEIINTGACECPPRQLFLEGDGGDVAFEAVASGAQTISLSTDVVNVNSIREGDQIKIVAEGSEITDSDTLVQINPYYLVVNKQHGGRDITLDRTPVTADGSPITGPIGVLRDSYRVFSHRILSAPFKKSATFEVDIKWMITLS
jgi:hypothetical protein